MDNKKYNFFCFVLEPKKESSNPTAELEQLQRTLLSKYDPFVATIIHDKDILENGEIKHTHAHVFINSPTKSTCKQMLLRFTELLQVSPQQIQIQGTNNEYLQVQYLVHKNDLDKHQYNFTDIKTNDAKLLETLFDKIYTSPEQIKLNQERDILECKTIIELLNRQGLEFTNRHRAIFNQIKQEQHIGYDMLLSYIKSYEKAIDSIKKAITNFRTYDNFIDCKIIENILHSINFDK